jgi:hypothetical protein
MILNVIDALFGCWHRNYSFPITTRNNQRHSEAAAVTGTYVVCLDCGKEFPYSWAEMKVVSMPRERQSAIAETAESYATKSAA